MRRFYLLIKILTAILCLLIVLSSINGFISVNQLKNGPISINRWIPHQGKKQITVGPSEPEWVSLNRVSLFAVYAIVVAEDARFYQHHGLDLKEIKNSLKINWQHRKIIRGASTITQQVIKMAFLSNEKTMWRKIKEALGSIILEVILPKDSILTWYLNLVPFGEGIYGIGNGAKFYFDTDPELLTISESVKLALIIPSPNARSKSLRAKHLEAASQKRYFTIVSKMLASGYITSQQWAEAIANGDFGQPIMY